METDRRRVEYLTLAEFLRKTLKSKNNGMPATLIVEEVLNKWQRNPIVTDGAFDTGKKKKKKEKTKKKYVNVYV